MAIADTVQQARAIVPGCTGTSVDTTAIDRLQTNAADTRALTGTGGIESESDGGEGGGSGEGAGSGAGGADTELDSSELYGLRPGDNITQTANIHHRDSATVTSATTWRTDSQLLCATPNQLHHLDLRSHTQVRKEGRAWLERAGLWPRPS